MAMTEKRMIRLINNLQKLADNGKYNRYGCVMLYNNYMFATDGYIIHRVEFSGLPYMTFEQEKNRWYRVYVEEDRIKFTDDDNTIDRVNRTHGGRVTYENFLSLLEYNNTVPGQWVNPAFMKKALEPYNIAQLSVVVKTVDKYKIALNGWNDYLTIHTSLMGIRK